MIVVFLLGLFSFLLSVLFLFYLVSQRKYNYWKKQKVPHLKPTPFLGNYGDFLLQRKDIGKVAAEICQKFPDEPYVGAFVGADPTLIVMDPEIIKLITTKDFYYFNSRELMDNVHKEVIGQSLFFTHGDRWKVVRQNLTPMFTSAKMKNMFQLIANCAYLFENNLDEETKISDVVEAKSLMAKYTMDCIGSCAFGVDTNSQKGDQSTNPFRKIGSAIFDVSYLRGLAMAVRQIYPTIFYKLGFKIFPSVINNFFNHFVVNVLKERQYKPSSRNDFIDLVMGLKTNTYITGDSMSNKATEVKKKITIKVDDDFLAAQCVVIFAGGFETSSSALSLTLYELSKNQEAQKRALEEVDAYMSRHQDRLVYECVSELPYLEACIEETMRLYPLFGVITREVVEDYTLPSGVRLEKGVRIHIPSYYLQRRPEYFPEPERYRPERMLPEEKSNIKPYTFLPFGEGPRICIGMRFAKMQMMPGLVTLLKKYRVELADGTPHKLELVPMSITTQPKDDINLRLVLREGCEQRVFKR